MAETYSTYEAKARFREILRKVRAGQCVVIADRGEEVAEIRPLRGNKAGFDERFRMLEERGVISPGGKPPRHLKPLANRPGALAEFLESRR